MTSTSVLLTLVVPWGRSTTVNWEARPGAGFTSSAWSSPHESSAVPEGARVCICTSSWGAPAGRKIFRIVPAWLPTSVGSVEKWIRRWASTARNCGRSLKVLRGSITNSEAPVSLLSSSLKLKTTTSRVRSRLPRSSVGV